MNSSDWNKINWTTCCITECLKYQFFNKIYNIAATFLLCFVYTLRAFFCSLKKLYNEIWIHKEMTVLFCLHIYQMISRQICTTGKYITKMNVSELLLCIRFEVEGIFWIFLSFFSNVRGGKSSKKGSKSLVNP